MHCRGGLSHGHSVGSIAPACKGARFACGSFGGKGFSNPLGSQERGTAVAEGSTVCIKGKAYGLRGFGNGNTVDVYNGGGIVYPVELTVAEGRLKIEIIIIARSVEGKGVAAKEIGRASCRERV